MNEENSPPEFIPQISITDEENVEVPAESEAEEPLSGIPGQEQQGEAEGRHPSVSLQLMDKQHEWLAEIEAKCASLETAFITKMQFVALSNHFQEYLKELEEKETLAREKGEFANLFNKFRTCYASSQKFHNKLMEVKGRKELVEAENRILKKRLFDQQIRLDALQVHLGNAREEVEEKEREKLAVQKQLIDLKEETEKLKSQQHPEKEEADEPPTRVAVTGDTKEELKIRHLEEEVESLKSDLAFSSEREATLSAKLDRADKTTASLKNELTSARSELQRQISQRERVEEAFAQTSENLSKKSELASELAQEVQELKSELEMSKSKCSSLLKDLRSNSKKLDAATQSIEKLRRDLDIRENRLKAAAEQRRSLEAEITNKQGEIFALKVDLANVSKQKSELSRQVALLKKKVLEMEAGAQNLQEQIVSKQKLIDALEKEHVENEDKMKELTKQKDAFMQESQKQEQIIINLRLDIKSSEEKIADIIKELNAGKQEITRLQDIIRRLVKAKDKMAADALELNRNISHLKGEIKGLQIQMDDSKKMVMKLSREIEEERAKYKLLAIDERFYRKSCADANRMIEKQNEDQNLLNKHILQLKSYNQELDDQRKKLEVQLKCSTEQLESAKEFLKQKTKITKEMSETIQRKDDDLKSRLKNISNLQQELDNLKKELESTTKDKDALSKKLSESDAQIASYKERIELMEHDLTVSNRTLAEREDDIKLLKLQLLEMHRIHSLMEKKVENMHMTRQELIEIQQEFQDQKFKFKRMEMEVQRPINFHRWRILEGTDPDHAMLVSKVHALQKQLIQKVSEMDAREVQLREKEQLIQKLREMLRRRPDTAAAGELIDCKRELKSRMERLKCLTTERNMFENLVEKYRQETMALRDQLKKYKMEEFEVKRKKVVRK
ncbi:Cilia- and flagella-associated protein 58 like protein [Argiope bruennichi]|uniref:Cilia- and flagella-associated protein 58 like protein n=1 Tax=Argiope bruennichi TaxID=94029 RepID=A0A8T0FV42_ARGBR|nr:Cilia- and flagella-associated protein 58 like protein [Argiope bruennichi]